MDNLPAIELYKYQVDIVNSIQNNIAVGKKMQSVYLPNAAGKSVMASALAIHYAQEQWDVLVCDDCTRYHPYYKMLKASSDDMEHIHFVDYKNVYKWSNKKIGLIITDAISTAISNDTILNINSGINHASIAEKKAEDPAELI